MESFEEDIFCIQCGYDLRATADGRCSECGTPFTRNEYRKSVIPWENPGRFRYMRTVWKIIFGKKLTFEIYRQHDAKRARLFRRITALALGAVLAGGYLMLNFFAENTIGNVMISQLRFIMNTILMTGSNPLAAFFDLFLMLGMSLQGAMGWIMPPIVLAMLARDMTHAPGDVLRRKTDSPLLADRAQAMGCYLSAYFGAALLLIIPITLQQAICLIMEIPGVFSFELRHVGSYNLLEGFVYAIGFALLLFGLVGLPLMLLFRTHQWNLALYRLEFHSLLGTVSRLIWTLLWRAFFWLLFIPCVVGLLRMVVFGLRSWR